MAYITSCWWWSW